MFSLWCEVIVLPSEDAKAGLRLGQQVEVMSLVGCAVGHEFWCGLQLGRVRHKVGVRVLAATWKP